MFTETRLYRSPALRRIRTVSRWRVMFFRKQRARLVQRGPCVLLLCEGQRINDLFLFRSGGVPRLRCETDTSRSGNEYVLSRGLSTKTPTGQWVSSCVLWTIACWLFLDAKKGAPGIAPGSGQAGGQGMPDPIGALQTLARQGTGNNQMMGMAGPGPNQQGMVPQPPSNTAANCKPPSY